MIPLILFFGALILLAGVLILINPETVFGYLRSNMDKPGLHIAAIVVRLVLGALLITQADASRFPVIMEILGWILILAGVVLGLIGSKKFQGLMSWAISLAKTYGRVAGVFATAFGVFLIYAFV